MNRKSWKNAFLGVTILVAILVVFGVITKFVNQSEQEKRFAELKGIGLEPNDSLIVNKFYKNMKAIAIQVGDKNLDSLFVNIDKKQVPKDAKSRIISWNLLLTGSMNKKNLSQSFSEINYSMGTFSFANYFYCREWDKAFVSDIDYLNKGRFVAVLKTSNVNLPEVGSDYFDSGSIKGKLLMFDLKDLSCVAVLVVYAENSENPEVRTFIEKEAAMKKLNNDLYSQYYKKARLAMQSCLQE
jgi:hypothetical protein